MGCIVEGNLEIKKSSKHYDSSRVLPAIPEASLYGFEKEDQLQTTNKSSFGS